MKFLSKTEENNLIWESSKEIPSTDYLSILLDAKHMLEHIIKNINLRSPNYTTPTVSISKMPSIGELGAINSTIKKVYDSMGMDSNEKPVI